MMFISTMNILVPGGTIFLLLYLGYYLFKDWGKYYEDSDGTIKEFTVKIHE